MFTRRAFIAAAACLIGDQALAATSFSTARKWLICPVDPTDFRRLTSQYGYRILGGKRQYHRGVDLAAPPGTKVLAAREGIVDKTSWDARSGWYVAVNHPGGWRTAYCHLRSDPSRFVRPGQVVRTGQHIGKVGSTGRSTGPHLHLTLRFQGSTVDPLPHMLTPLETYYWLQTWGPR